MISLIWNQISFSCSHHSHVKQMASRMNSCISDSKILIDTQINGLSNFKFDDIFNTFRIILQLQYCMYDSVIQYFNVYHFLAEVSALGGDLSTITWLATSSWMKDSFV